VTLELDETVRDYFHRDFDPETIAWVFDREALDSLAGSLYTADRVVMDLENTGLAEHAWLGGPLNGGYPARIVLASLTVPQPDDAGDPTTWVVPLSHPESPWSGRWRRIMREIAVNLVEADKPLENHNLKYDGRWVFAHTGIDLTHLYAWDTQMSSHAQDENRSNKLKDVVPATFGVERWDDHDLTTPGAAEKVPLFELGTYAARDTYWAWRLGEHDRNTMMIDGEHEQPETPEEIEVARLGRLMGWCSVPTVATLGAIEQRGMVLDTDWVHRELKEREDGYRAAFEQLAPRYTKRRDGTPLDPGDASFAPTSLWFRAWTEAAVDAGDLQVAALTPNGKPQWSKSVLKRQARRGSPVAQLLLDYRGDAKKAEFLHAWLNSVTQNGTVHTTYNAGSVVTGRLSSSDPNLQQVTQVLKMAYVPRPGYVFADLDYSQIEMRAAAHISGCISMLEAFRRGDDLHRMLAQRIVQNREDHRASDERRERRLIMLEDVTAEERQGGKSANFGLLYGLGPYGFREYAEDVYDVVMTLEEATAAHRAFFEMWEGIADWHARTVHRLHQTGQVVSPLGRVRRLPGVWDANEKLVQYCERAAINSPVQGFASDLMQMAAASIEGNLPGHDAVKGVRLVGTVHDSILAEVPEDTWQESALACRERMLGVADVIKKLDCNLAVPLAADVKVGTRWGLSDVGSL
jgi:DNA polymerase-1